MDQATKAKEKVKELSEALKVEKLLITQKDDEIQDAFLKFLLMKPKSKKKLLLLLLLKLLEGMMLWTRDKQIRAIKTRSSLHHRRISILLFIFLIFFFEIIGCLFVLRLLYFCFKNNGYFLCSFSFYRSLFQMQL